MKMKAKFMAGLLGGVLVTLPVAGCFTGCNLVREDLAECPMPVVELRFVYEYNMEFANAFHNQVDCLAAYFFNSDGRLVAIEKVTEQELLADENYRMHPELPVGDYHVVAYGGMECERASFSNSNMTDGSLLTDMQVHLNPACLIDDGKRRLHNQFFGAADFSVDTENDTRATVQMMRNTNSIQIALQHLNGKPVDCNDFDYEITDDNNDFDYDNNLLATGEITYKPYNTENRATGTSVDEENGGEVQQWYAALAQFTTSRLVKRTVQNNKQTSTYLHVRRVKDGKTIIRIPLINYMLLFKSNNTAAGLDYMGDQEYLDRENTWNFVFFLDENNLWISTRLIINDWEVRLNTPDF